MNENLKIDIIKELKLVINGAFKIVPCIYLPDDVFYVVCEDCRYEYHYASMG